MLRNFKFTCIIFAILLQSGFGKDCSVDLKDEKLKDVFLNHLKWVEPKSSKSSKCANGETVNFECSTGFLDNRLFGDSYTFKCANGKYNGTFDFPDLLCRNNFQNNLIVEAVHSAQLRSTILKCDQPGLQLFSINRKIDKGEKTLYRVCLDKNTMRAKFAVKPASDGPTIWQNFRPVQRQQSRDDDVWGFDGYGKTAIERMWLSQAYVKNIQQPRLTALYPELNRGRQYPYYFNRGHLVAFRDFYEYEDQKATVEYLNAAPQWDVLNKHSWSLIEQESREIIEKNPRDWEVYTGTYGIIQAPNGLMFVGRSSKVPVPQLFWKIVHNTKDSSQSRAFVGVNNPEFKKFLDVKPAYIICQNLVRVKDKTFKGDEYKGFTYECPIKEFLAALSTKEKIAKPLKN